MSTWTIQICDLNGNALQNITGIATSRVGTFKLNRPASFEFTVPSQHPQIATIYSDGLPYLCELARVIKAYRLEVQQDGSIKNVIRFAGIVYQIEDDADANACYTKITAYDPYQKMMQRLVYTAGGVSAYVPFTGTDICQIAKTIVDNSKAIKGRTGISTAGSDGAHFDVGSTYTIAWQNKMVADALNDLTVASTGGLDLYFKPIDKTDGNLVAMQCWVPKRGMTTTTVFGWGIYPKNLQKLNRSVDGTNMGNDLTGIASTTSGSDNITARAADATSVGLYDSYERVNTYGDVKDATQLSAMLSGDLVSSKRAAPTYDLTPQPDLAPPPWQDANGAYTYDLGDYVTVQAGPDYRGGFSTQMRVYGYQITLTDEGQEQVTAVYTAPDS